MHRSSHTVIAVGLIACALLVNSFVYVQAVGHESHHAHHQKATHGTVLCSWLCAAGQVLDGSVAPHLADGAPVAFLEQIDFQSTPRIVLSTSTSRGPPFHSII